MALSTRKENIIKATWKTGEFKNPSQLAKHFKIDRKTALKIIGEIQPENSDIVEAGILYESAKKSLKNPVEILAVEKAVDERLIHAELFTSSSLKNQELANKSLDAIEYMRNEAKDDKAKHEISLASMNVLKDHSVITAKNKDTVLGKDADTQVNIQNSNQMNNISIEWE